MIKKSWKLPFISYKLLQIINNSKKLKKNKIWSKNTNIPWLKTLAISLKVYNGKIFRLEQINYAGMFGRKLGEYIFTRQQNIFKSKRNKKKKK